MSKRPEVIHISGIIFLVNIIIFANDSILKVFFHGLGRLIWMRIDLHPGGRTGVGLLGEDATHHGHPKGGKSHLHVVHCNCGITPSYQLVFNTISSFDANRKQVVIDLGFGGFLDFPEVAYTFEQFGVWVLGMVDAESEELIINSMARVPITTDLANHFFWHTFFW